MSKYIKRIFIALCFVFISGNVFAQDDPLIPQSFAVDTKSQTMAVLDEPENTIAILKRTNDGFKITKSILVDLTKGRHDVQFIYRPMSVAIYEQNIVFLASNRDSCYIRIVDLEGNDVYSSPKFTGSASTFSYDKQTRHLYIAGLNNTGYNVFDIDCTDGFANIRIDSVSSSHAAYMNYKIPKKSEEIAKHDPTGLGLTVIAMSTVFFALVIISIVLMGFARALHSAQKKKAKETIPNKQERKEAVQEFKAGGNLSGEALAAISAAIHLYNEELHDEENTILTIVKVEKRYSPWSSKIHNMNVYRR
ncbi:MAG: OadG family protein [Bacteroidales bacterium]|nr:OadG family protein [Bacteroidales bacterium]